MIKKSAIIHLLSLLYPKRPLNTCELLILTQPVLRSILTCKRKFPYLRLCVHLLLILPHDLDVPCVPLGQICVPLQLKVQFSCLVKHVIVFGLGM